MERKRGITRKNGKRACISVSSTSLYFHFCISSFHGRRKRVNKRNARALAILRAFICSTVHRPADFFANDTRSSRLIECAFLESTGPNETFHLLIYRRNSVIVASIGNNVQVKYILAQVIETLASLCLNVAVLF